MLLMKTALKNVNTRKALRFCMIVLDSENFYWHVASAVNVGNPDSTETTNMMVDIIN